MSKQNDGTDRVFWITFGIAVTTLTAYIGLVVSGFHPLYAITIGFPALLAQRYIATENRAAVIT